MIEILLVDDHRVLLNGISASLSKNADLKVIGEVTDGYAALEFLVQATRLPDLLITDLEMKGMNGLVLLQHLMEQYPDLKVIVLTQHDQYEKAAIDTGARGYILKDEKIEEIVNAIRLVMAGKIYRSGMQRDGATIMAMPEFTTRELKIIRMIVDEYTTRQIAEKLNLPFSAVETHTKSIRRKTGASNIAGIVKYALKNKICE